MYVCELEGIQLDANFRHRFFSLPHHHHLLFFWKDGSAILINTLNFMKPEIFCSLFLLNKSGNTLHIYVCLWINHFVVEIFHSQLSLKKTVYISLSTIISNVILL